MLHAASSQTKDCLLLLKLLGVPVIQVRPARHISSYFSRCLFPSFILFMHFHVYLPLFLSVLCFRLQGMLRRCAPSWRERGLWTLWLQRTWTRCRLEPIFSFASLTPRRTGRNSAIHVLLKGCTGVFLCFNQFLSIIHIHAGNFPKYSTDIYIVKFLCPTWCVCRNVFLVKLLSSSEVVWGRCI